MREYKVPLIPPLIDNQSPLWHFHFFIIKNSSTINILVTYVFVGIYFFFNNIAFFKV